MEFKGWVTDYSKSSLSGNITNGETTIFLKYLEKMVPQQAQRWIDWDQIRKEQGTWPKEIMASMWFNHETSLIVMTDLLKRMKEELDKAACDINGQRVKARLEVSSHKRPLAQAQAMFFKGLKEVGGDESKVRGFNGKLQISFLAEGRTCCQKHTGGRRSRG